jgi:hypothetical protein
MPLLLGIVVEHESEPFSVKVWVEGKLRSRLRRLRFGFQKKDTDHRRDFAWNKHW